jgi:hypothetical protein
VEGFAPTSRSAQKLAEAGMETSTLQKHLARGEQPDSGERRVLSVDQVNALKYKNFLPTNDPDANKRRSRTAWATNRFNKAVIPMSIPRIQGKGLWKFCEEDVHQFIQDQRRR